MFHTQKLNEKGFKEVKELKTAMSLAVTQSLILIPEGREKSIFITKIEEAMFFATKAVSSKDGNFEEIIDY